MRGRLRCWQGMAGMVAALALAPGEARAQGGEITVGVGAHASYPEYVSGSISLRSSLERMDGTRQGFVILIEPGYNGGRLAIGREFGIGPSTWLVGTSMLHTWNQPPETKAGITYLMTETRLSMAWFVLGANFGFRVGGGGSTQAGVFSLDPGVKSFVIGGVIGFHWPL